VRFDWILRDVSDLRTQLEELRARIEILHREISSGISILSRRLKARGLKIYRQNPREKLLIPSDLSFDLTTGFYEKMKRYSFRLFLRDLVQTKGPFCPDDLTRYCSSRIVDEYIRFLNATGTVVPLKGDRYRLNRSEISSFGPTLEWFVTQMFQREFACPAMFGVHFKEIDTGGDYDVLALWEGRLVYVEVKSSPPKSIEDPEVKAFLSRLNDLIPDMAFFFNDTHLRMKDKVIRLFMQEMEREREGMVFLNSPQKLSDEIYHVDHWIYILNSKRDIVTNFSLCLRDHLRQRRDRRPWRGQCQ
jgi:hypothetical protein